MSTIKYAPDVDHYLDWLSYRHQGLSNNNIYDKESTLKLKGVFEKLKHITPIGKNDSYELWFCVERGKIEDFGDYNEWLEMEDVNSFDEFRDTWLSYYPEELKWFNFAAVEDVDNGYMAIFINHKLVFEVSEREKTGTIIDVSDFASWLQSEVNDCIERIKNGTYNDFVKNNLPYEHRTGTILQKHLWEIYPEDMEEFFEGISSEDATFFLENVKKQISNNDVGKVKFVEMTANKFYYCCSVGYKGMGYKHCELSPKEQYYKHADGRDEGLSEINGDSATAFEEWLNNRTKIGHPWEVCRGGNSTHISLYVHKDIGGYYFYLSGSSYSRTTETIKFYNALVREGVPVIIDEAENMVARVLGTEKVGIVPRGIIPSYRSEDFPGENVISFMNLPFENEKEVIEKCEWQPIKEVFLKQNYFDKKTTAD